MADVFLSYGHDDLATAKRYAEAFERAGFSIWWDESLRSGEAFDAAIEKEIKGAKAVVVLWSKSSVQSRWVRAEATLAEKSGTLVPALIEPCELPIMFQLTHTVDLTRWKGEAGEAGWQALMADVRRLASTDAAPAQRPRVLVAPKSASRRWMLAACALVVLAASGGWWAFTHWSAGATGLASGQTSAPVTLAVLPFVNLSSDVEQEYFSDGLTEEILNQLAQIEGLAVTARTSSFSFKGRNEDVRTIGEKLGVGHLLEGSIRKDARQLRITAQLVSTRDGTHVWSHVYDRELSGVFQLQEQIAKDVAQALSIKLDVGEMRRANGGTTNLEAYDKFLQAAALLGKGYNKDFATQAVELGREVVALDPNFLRGWDQLALALAAMQVWAPENAMALRGEAEKAVARIVSLAPESEQARRIRLEQLLEQRRWLDAAALIDSAADEPEVQRLAYGLLRDTGRFEELLPIVRHACTRDPLSLACSAQLQDVEAAVGRSEEAQAEYERSKGLVGAHIESDAIALVRYGVGPNPDPKILLANFLAILKDGNRPVTFDSEQIDRIRTLDDARALLHKTLDDQANNEGLRILIIAFWASALGDRDLAMTALRRANIDMHARTANLWLVSYSRGWRADPRFKAILRDTGLVDYFRASGKWGDFCKPVGKDDFECH